MTLTLTDWAVVIIIAAVLLIGMEAVKLQLRAGRPAAPLAYLQATRAG